MSLYRAQQLALVQSKLGLTLRDVYLQMTILGIGCLVSHVLAARQACDAHSLAVTSENVADDEGLAVAASEF